MVGTELAYAMVGLEAVIRSDAGLTVTNPATYVME